MKKILWLLITAFVLTTVQPLFALAESEENPILLQQNFEGCKINEIPGVYFHNPNGARKVKVDKEHGESLALSGSFPVYTPEETWNKGCYRVSFSFYDTTEGKTNYIRIMKDRNGSIFDSRNLKETFVAESGKLGYYKQQTGWTMADSNIPYNMNHWYDIDIWFDFDKAIIYYDVDGERLSEEAMTHAFTCIDGVIFQMQGDVVLDNLLIQKITEPALVEGAPDELYYITENNLVNVKVRTDEVGNAFFDDENPVLNLDITNTSEKAATWNTKVVTRDWENQNVWAEAFEISINPGETVTKKLVPETDKYGIYDLEITLTNSERTITRTSEFSRVRSATAKNYKMGVCHHVGQKSHGAYLEIYDLEIYDYIDKSIEFIDKAGFGLIRDDLATWDYYEKKPGEYKISDDLITYVDKLRDKGLEVLGILGLGNTLYMNGGDWKMTTPSQLEAYYNFVYNVVKDWGGRVKYFDVFNEWPFEELADEYVAVMLTAYEAAKKANPETRVVGFCSAGYPASSIEYMLQVLDGRKAFDDISVHPYRWPANPERGYAGFIKRGNAVMEKYGYGDALVHGNEFGYPVGPTANTELEQATYGILNYCINDTDDLCDTLWWYDLQNDGWNVEYTEHNYGQIKNWNENGDEVTWAPKPVYLATSQYNEMVAGGEFQKRIENDDMSIFHYKGRETQDIIIATSRDKESKVLALDLGCETVNLYDMFGNKKEISGINGKYTFIIDDTISYIEGNFSKIEECSPTVSIMEPTVAAIANSKEYFEISGTTGDKLIVIGTENVNIESISDFSNGSARFVYNTKSLPKENERIKIEIKREGKTIFYAELSVKETSSIGIASFEVKPYSLKDVNHWMAEITLKNNNTYKTNNGEIVFSSPDPIREKINKLCFTDLKPKESKKLYLHFPSGIRSMSTLAGKIVTDDGEEVELFKKLETDIARRVEKAPVIDGFLDEWDFYGGMYMDDVSMRVPGVSEGYAGLSDCSGRAKVSWDDENMYFAAEVTDDVLKGNDSDDPQDIWSYDSIQLGIASSKSVPVFTEIGFGLAKQKAIAYGYTFEQGGEASGVIENAEVEIRREGTTTIYEARVPWKEFLPNNIKPEKGGGIFFAMCFNDNDTGLRGRRKAMEYGGGMVLGKDASKFIQTLFY